MRHQKRLRITIFAAVVLASLAVTAAPSLAATVTGAVKNSKGYQILLVQANGTARTARLATSAGTFSISGVDLRNASLQLVRADGSYYGPLVLKATATDAFTFIKGATSLRIGAATRRGGCAVLRVQPTRRCQTLAAYTAKAVGGRPIGVGRLGRVITSEPQGLNGPGADLDLDGVVNAFDIDDNGNLILDNVDRSGRGSTQPRTAVSGAAPTSARRIAHYDEFRMSSGFELAGATSINVDIPEIADVEGLIARFLPPTVVLSAQVIGGAGELDGHGNSYLRDHTLSGVTYPLVNFAPATHTGNLLDLVAGSGNDALIVPGALPSQIGAGDSFVEVAADGASYPGSLSFVFNTAPALESYQFDTAPAATEVAYDADGVSSQGMTPQSRLPVPSGATKITLTFWRPQRQATTGEMGNADGWVDIGGLEYRVDIPAAPTTGDGFESASTHDATGSYSDALANGAPIASALTDGGVLDPVADTASSSTNTITFTVDLPTCFSGWATLGSGAQFDLVIRALSAHGDNAARTLYFSLD
jgi:hypothetical protein